MNPLSYRISGRLAELKRRRIFRVTGLYAAGSFAAIQGADIVLPALGLPPWTLTATVVVALLGFPIAVGLGWIYQLAPDGGGVDPSTPADVTSPPPPRPKTYLLPAAFAGGMATMFLVAAGAHLVPLMPAFEERRVGATVSLAMLPFQAISGGASEELLSVGMADAIISNLSTVERLRVRPTAAVLPFTGPGVDVREAGKALGVSFVGTGTYQVTGDQVRVSVQLVRVSDGSTTWAAKYDLPRSDLLALQDSLATRVTESLSLSWTAADRERLYRRYTADAATYAAYLEGRAHLVKRTEEHTRAAVAAFERALARDPDYALARAGLGMAAAELYLRYPRSVEEAVIWRDRAFQEAHRALALDPGLAEAHEALAAMYRKTEFDWDRTIQESARALELNPNLEMPHYYMAGALYHIGLLERAERVARTGQSVNPTTGDRAEALRTEGMAVFFDGRFAEAVKLLEEASRRSDAAIADWNLSMAYYYAGDRERGKTLMEALLPHESESAAARARATLAAFLAAAGKDGRARELVLEGTGAGAHQDHHVAYALGAAFAQLGNPDEAVRWLRAAAETGFPCHPWYARDPLLDPIRGRPDFQVLLEELRVSSEAASRRYAAL